MSKLLREYDSEYHFLCTKVLEFEKAGRVEAMAKVQKIGAMSAMDMDDMPGMKMK